MEKVIFVTQTLGPKAGCGIGLIGKLLSESLVKSKKYDFEILYADDAATLDAKIAEINPKVVIYNYHSHTAPLAQDQSIRSKYPNIVYIMLHHDMHQQLVDSYSPASNFGIKYLITADTTLRGNDNVFLVNRLIPPHQPKPYVDLGIPVIGFQGFGPPHKGIYRIAQQVQHEFDEAIIRLHIPFSFFGDPQGREARARVAEVMSIITKPGIKVEATHDLRSTEDIIEFLGQNTINCYFYDLLPGAGLASSPDYALAARRPIAVTKSHQLRNFIGLSPSVCIEDNSLKDIISFGSKPLEGLHEFYTEESVIGDYERIIDKLIAGN